jgi:hypothetical protein
MGTKDNEVSSLDQGFKREFKISNNTNRGECRLSIIRKDDVQGSGESFSMKAKCINKGFGNEVVARTGVYQRNTRVHTDSTTNA